MCTALLLVAENFTCPFASNKYLNDESTALSCTFVFLHILVASTYIVNSLCLLLSCKAK